MAAEHAPAPERVRYIVSTWAPEEQLAAWNRWHSEIPIPEVVDAGQ